MNNVVNAVAFWVENSFIVEVVAALAEAEKYADLEKLKKEFLTNVIKYLQVKRFLMKLNLLNAYLWILQEKLIQQS